MLRLSGRSHLEHYAGEFNCVEINSSFYRSHRRATYERWCASTPADFAFSVKLPRSITHESALRKCRPETERFLHEIAGLGSKLHTLLVQLPPSLEFHAPSASRFFTLVSALCSSPIVCECRHPSWFTARAEGMFVRCGIGRVGTDPPRAAGGDLPGGATRLKYWRLHGSPRVYYSRYGDGFLAALAAQVQHSRATARELWCIFDNTAEHAAWADALRLCELLRSATKQAVRSAAQRS